MKKKRKENSKKQKKGNSMALYFTKENENAIIEYIQTDDIKRRTDLYIRMIEPVFSEMVDKIIYTYRFTSSLPNIEELKIECKDWLITVIDKYDHSKGSKAFSYFSVITKNWFIHKTKVNTKTVKQEIELDSITNEFEYEHLSFNLNYDVFREVREFWNSFYDEMKSWELLELKDTEKKVLSAVVRLFEDVDDIQIFNKKAIYFYIREMTGFTTKQVVLNLAEIRNKYKIFKSRWKNSEI